MVVMVDKWSKYTVEFVVVRRCYKNGWQLQRVKKMKTAVGWVPLTTEPADSPFRQSAARAKAWLEPWNGVAIED